MIKTFTGPRRSGLTYQRLMAARESRMLVLYVVQWLAAKEDANRLLGQTAPLVSVFTIDEATTSGVARRVRFDRLVIDDAEKMPLDVLLRLMEGLPEVEIIAHPPTAAPRTQSTRQECEARTRALIADPGIDEETRRFLAVMLDLMPGSCGRPTDCLCTSGSYGHDNQACPHHVHDWLPSGTTRLLHCRCGSVVDCIARSRIYPSMDAFEKSAAAWRTHPGTGQPMEPAGPAVHVRVGDPPAVQTLHESMADLGRGASVRLAEITDHPRDANGAPLDVPAAPLPCKHGFLTASGGAPCLACLTDEQTHQQRRTADALEKIAAYFEVTGIPVRPRPRLVHRLAALLEGTASWLRSDGWR